MERGLELDPEKEEVFRFSSPWRVLNAVACFRNAGIMENCRCSEGTGVRVSIHTGVTLSMALSHLEGLNLAPGKSGPLISFLPPMAQTSYPFS